LRLPGQGQHHLGTFVAAAEDYGLVGFAEFQFVELVDHG